MNKKFKILAFIICVCTAFLINVSKTYVGAKDNDNLNLSAKSAYLIDYNSGTVIYSLNENERRPIASMTKIMLLLLAYENVDNGALSLNEEIIVSKNASSMGGSQVFLEENGKYLVGDLLKSITVASANDASVAIAERLYGSEKACVKKMNEKAVDLNLKNTLFANCTGLPAPMQYSTAKDIATIFCNLIKYENYFKFSTIWLDKINHKNNSTEISNTNKLIRFYEGCDGGKTGYTAEAGYCLTATAKRGNMRLIGSVINSPSSKERFADVSSMFNYGFDNYVNKCVVDSNIPLQDKLKVENSKIKEVEIIPERDGFVFTLKNSNDKIEVDVDLFNLKAPIKKGDIVGSISIYKNGILTQKINVISNESVDKMGFFDRVKDLLENWA